MINAKDLRNPEALMQVSGEKSGYYKWWADKETLLNILDKLRVVDFASIENALDRKEDLYCIYIGIAVKESLRSRINWHINQHHTKAAVRSGTLSTLRQSISSLMFGNQYNENDTNIFIDLLKVELFYSPYPIRSTEAIKQLTELESKTMANYLYLLNIRGNNHPQASVIRTKLTELRRNSK